MTWYEPYKVYGDTIICMFVYLGFIWHCFKNLNNIISGSNSLATRSQDIESHEFLERHSTKL